MGGGWCLNERDGKTVIGFYCVFLGCWMAELWDE